MHVKPLYNNATGCGGLTNRHQRHEPSAYGGEGPTNIPEHIIRTLIIHKSLQTGHYDLVTGGYCLSFNDISLAQLVFVQLQSTFTGSSPEPTNVSGSCAHNRPLATRHTMIALIKQLKTNSSNDICQCLCAQVNEL